MPERVHLVSLGCAKNRVDSEVMAGKLQRGEWELVDSPEAADVIIVNTCSFIQPATEESVDTVLDMARYKELGTCKKLVVTGCMVQRYGASLEGELPSAPASTTASTTSWPGGARSGAATSTRRCTSTTSWPRA
jgi:ribosomal protein S12 methylthiotransferase